MLEKELPQQKKCKGAAIMTEAILVAKEDGFLWLLSLSLLSLRFIGDHFHFNRFLCENADPPTPHSVVDACKFRSTL
jgi:hypothetical protein